MLGCLGLVNVSVVMFGCVLVDFTDALLLFSVIDLLVCCCSLDLGGFVGLDELIVGLILF